MVKFRAKVIDTGEWITTKNGKASIKYVKEHMRDKAYMDDIPVDPQTIGQYMDMYDNVTEADIYVGDIVSRTNLRYMGNGITDDIVETILIQSVAIEYFDESTIGIEKLGNIYDNPELWQNHLSAMSMNNSDN